jgi:RNA 2',3'-cyclic 3'-phosphodiesterase
VPPEQWHLTLAFYDEVDEGKVDKLQEGLARAAERTSPFGVRLATAGTFPRQATRARVLWIGLDGEVDALRRLADRCAGAARRARIAVDDRKFRPHLTLARARRETVDVHHVVQRLASYTSPWWSVTSLRLVHSTLGSVVRHETLREFELRLPTDHDVET